MSELFILAGNKRYGACNDEGQGYKNDSRMKRLKSNLNKENAERMQLIKGEQLVAKTMGDILLICIFHADRTMPFPSEGDCLYEIKSRMEWNGRAMEWL